MINRSNGWKKHNVENSVIWGESGPIKVYFTMVTEATKGSLNVTRG